MKIVNGQEQFSPESPVSPEHDTIATSEQARLLGAMATLATRLRAPDATTDQWLAHVNTVTEAIPSEYLQQFIDFTELVTPPEQDADREPLNATAQTILLRVLGQPILGVYEDEIPAIAQIIGDMHNEVVAHGGNYGHSPVQGHTIELLERRMRGQKRAEIKDALDISYEEISNRLSWVRHCITSRYDGRQREVFMEQLLAQRAEAKTPDQSVLY